MSDILDNYTSSYTGFPPQRISFKKKDKKWGIACMEAIAGYNTFSSGVDDYRKMKHNYNLFNGIIDPDDYSYVTDPHGMSETYGKASARMRNFNLVMNKINYFLGKEYELPFNFRVNASAGEGFNARNEHKKSLFIQFLNNSIKQQMVEYGLVDPQEVETNFQLPKDIQRYMNFSYQDIREKFLNTLLKVGYYRDGLKDKFNHCFKHASIVGKEIMYVGIVNGKMITRPVNPLFCSYIAHSEINHIEDSLAFKEVRMMNVGQIIDELGEYLSNEDIDKIQEGFLYGNNATRFMAENSIMPTIEELPTSTGLYYDLQSDYRGIPVIFCNWKSMRKIRYIKYIDENGEIQETIIEDEEFVITKEFKDFILEITEDWVTDIWEGVSIGDIYPYIRPCKNQINGKLNYVGQIYNNLNSTTTSILGMLSNHQKFYDIIWYKFEQELARAKGKKFIMDIAQLPASEGWTVQQWMHYFEDHGIAWINSAQEGNYGEQVAKFNQFTSVDMTLTSNIQGYFTSLREIERLMNEIVGLSPQALAQIGASETATGVNTAIGQTSTITKVWFIAHNQFKKRVLEHMIETYKITLSEGTQEVEWMDEVMREQVKIDGEQLGDTDYSLYVSDGVKENETFEMLKQLAQVALQNQLIEMSDLIDLYTNDSSVDYKRRIEAKEEEKKQVAQQQFESEQQAIEAQRQLEERRYQDELTLEYQKLDREDINKQLDREADLQKAQISAMGFSENQDINSNGIPDIAEQTRLALEASSLAFDQTTKILESKRKETELKSKQQIEQSKLALEKEKLAQDKQIKMEEIKLARENQKNDIAIARINKANRNQSKK